MNNFKNLSIEEKIKLLNEEQKDKVIAFLEETLYIKQGGNKETQIKQIAMANKKFFNSLNGDEKIPVVSLVIDMCTSFFSKDR